MEIHRRAVALIQDAAAAAIEPAAAVPSAPASATWNVTEAPASTCFRFCVGTMEMTHTMRGVDDNEILARIREFLPTLQELLETCEDRHAARQVARTAANAAQPPPELQQLVQQAVQQALAAQASGQPPADPPPARPPQEPPADTPEGYCATHQVWMEQRSNERGSWYSHLATDDAGEEYFCKGRGRSRRNGR